MGDDSEPSILDDYPKPTILDDDPKTGILDDDPQPSILEDNPKQNNLDNDIKECIVDDDTKRCIVDDDTKRCIVDDDTKHCIVDDDTKRCIVDDDAKRCIVDDNSNVDIKLNGIGSNLKQSLIHDNTKETIIGVMKQCIIDEKIQQCIRDNNLRDISSNNKHGCDYENTYLQSLHPGRLKSTLFSATILAYWDNVMGPVISKVWLGNDKVEITEEIVNYVSNHTLSGELLRGTDKNTIDPKFFVLADLGCIFFALIFIGNSKAGLTISSISFVMAYSEMDRYLLLRDFIGRQVKLLILTYRVLQQKDLKTAVKVFTSYLKKFVKTVDSLEELNVQQNICINETIFGEIDVALDAKLLDTKFLMRSITSHLQTCGCTIVCGKSHEKINMFIKTLSVFLSCSERYCSRYASADSNCVYIQDLFIQGILKTDEKMLSPTSISSKDIRLGSYPVSLIDVDKKSVHQTSQLCQHGVSQKDFLKEVLGMLLQGMGVADCPYTDLFTNDFGDISLMVQKFITELFALPNICSVRKKHIENFTAILQQKSLALLAYVEANSRSWNVSLDKTQIQQMQYDLLLSTESDFRIIVACVEKQQSGFAVFLDKEDAEFKAIIDTF